MEELELVPATAEEQSLTGFTSFFSNLVGQLVALPSLPQQWLRQEGLEVMVETTRLILSLVQHIVPDFPFDTLLDDFETPIEAEAVEATIPSIVEEVKKAAKQE
jgi:Na+/H+-dicarboxylate symporter